MPNWLKNELKRISDKNVAFVRRSTFYWMEALAFEIKSEYYTQGVLDNAKVISVLQNVTVVQSPATVSPYVFTSLYMSKNYLEFLKNAEDNLSGNAYNYPISIVSWYYLIYNAIQAILCTFGGLHLETHTSTIKYLDGQNITKILPYPFNVYAKKDMSSGKVEYNIINSKVTEANRIKDALAIEMNSDRIIAQSRIFAYIYKTATDFEQKKVEEILMREKRYPNFRTKVARADRDARLKDKINFLNTAYRYRGKVNYRDAICLSYKNISEGQSLINDLLVVGEFLYVYTIEFLRLRMGSGFVTNYLNDVED